MKKWMAAMLVISLIILSASAAFASGDGLFGELSRVDGADERLAALEEAAETLDLTYTTNTQVDIVLCQAYYEGNRVYISYKASKSWLGFQDGLNVSDDGYADIIAGEEMELDDGSMIGWKECIVPEDYLADTQTFGLVFWPNPDSEEMSTLSFTLNRNEYEQFLQGTTAPQKNQARANLYMGKVDMKGFISVISPEQAASWIVWFETGEGNGTDVIGSWSLYQNGELVSGDLYGAIGTNGDEEVVFGVMFPRMEDLTGLTLVPEYVEAGEKPEEAIILEPVAEE